MAKAHACSYPGCDEEPLYDLVLSKRVEKEIKCSHCTYLSKSRQMVEHLYLCPWHSLAVQEFMHAYEGGVDD